MTLMGFLAFMGATKKQGTKETIISAAVGTFTRQRLSSRNAQTAMTPMEVKLFSATQTASNLVSADGGAMPASHSRPTLTVMLHRRERMITFLVCVFIVGFVGGIFQSFKR